MAVEYCITVIDGGEVSFYGGDATSMGMSIPTFTDVSDMVTYSDIDDCYDDIDKLTAIYPSMEIHVSRYVTVDG